MAIGCADLHLSLSPPACRSAEPDWLSAQGRVLDEINSLAQKYRCPVVAAGDIFDKYDPKPELLSFAMEKLHGWYCVWGNHDLHLRLGDSLHKSGLWALHLCGAVLLLQQQSCELGGSCPARLHPFPYGRRPQQLTQGHSLILDIAVVHDYVWWKDAGHPGASQDSHLNSFRKKVKGYDVVLVGDNHIPWVWDDGTQWIVNCGGLFRRTSDQLDYRPACWLIRSDNSVLPHYVDVSKDKFVDQRDRLVRGGGRVDHGRFLAELGGLTDTAISFPEAVRRKLDGEGVCPEVRKIVEEALE